jgi:amidohydrolase
VTARIGGDPKSQVVEAVRESMPALTRLADDIHARPELAFEERYASELVAETLAGHGFAVTTGAYDLETALVAEAGEGPVCVALCAEYDALPDIGHACGHNLIAAAAVGAALALQRVADDVGLRVRVLGTPAEEVGDAGGKILMLERGAWDGVHASMMVHPGPFDDVAPPLIAISAFQVEYHGKEVHATTFSHLGVNAGAAAVIAEVALAEFRQQLQTRQRVHGIIEKYGSSANTLSGYSRLRYMIRDATTEGLAELRERVLRCFEAGALATGATMRVIGGDKPYAPLTTDRELAELFSRNVTEFSDRTFPAIGEGPATFAGTDMGNVSERVPTVHPMLGMGCFPVVNHQAEFTDVCRGAVAQTAVFDGAAGMASTAVDMATVEPVRSRLLR